MFIFRQNLENLIAGKAAALARADALAQQLTETRRLLDRTQGRYDALLTKIMAMKQSGFGLDQEPQGERWEGGRYSIEQEEQRMLRETVPPRQPPRFLEDDVRAFEAEIETAIMDLD